MAWAWASGVVGAGMWLSCVNTGANPSPPTDEAGGVSTASAEMRPAASSAAPERGSVVVATLRTKQSELTILSSSAGLRYSLLDAAGVAQPMTLEQLRAYDPNLFEVVRAATARSAARTGAGATAAEFVDARVEAAQGRGSAPAPIIPPLAEPPH